MKRALLAFLLFSTAAQADWVETGGYLNLPRLRLTSGTLTLSLTTATSTFVCGSATDSVTDGSTPSCIFQLGSNITASDMGWAFADSSGNKNVQILENGSLFSAGELSSSASLVANDHYAYTVGASVVVRGFDANDASAVGVKLSNITTLNTAGGKIVGIYPDNSSTLKASVDINGFFLQPSQTVTIADDATGAAPATAITPSSGVIKMAYNDATNSSVGTLVETGAQEGERISVLHTGSGGTVVFTDSSGVQEVGGTACTMALNAIMGAVYLNSQWNIDVCRQN